MSQSYTFGSAFYQSWYICHHKAFPITQIYYPQMRVQSRKMVIGYLRLCVTDYRQQGGFSYIGESYQPYVCNHLKLQLYPKLLSWLTGLSVLGHLHGGGSKMHITKTASSAFKNALPLVIPRHISNNLAGFKILNHSSFRHLYN